MLGFLKVLWPFLQPLIMDLLKLFLITKKTDVTERVDAQRIPIREVPVDRFDALLVRRGVQPA